MFEERASIQQFRVWFIIIFVLGFWLMFCYSNSVTNDLYSQSFNMATGLAAHRQERHDTLRSIFG
jgi:hypothetical protein